VKVSLALVQVRSTPALAPILHQHGGKGIAEGSRDGPLGPCSCVRLYDCKRVSGARCSYGVEGELAFSVKGFLAAVGENQERAAT
jgi:hypothetical protein